MVDAAAPRKSAGSGRRSDWERASSSVSLCIASPVEPPFPHVSTVRPPCSVSTTSFAACRRGSAWPSRNSAAPRSTRAARSRRASTTSKSEAIASRRPGPSLVPSRAVPPSRKPIRGVTTSMSTTTGPAPNCYVIAEIGINHNGDLDLAKKLIDLAIDTGCDAVKFQKRTVDIVYPAEVLDSPRESPWGDTQRDQKEGLEFGQEEFDE